MSSEPSKTIPPAQMSVLVVDDSSTMRRIVANSLARIGISGIVEAADGREALNKFDPATIDLIITDWLMPSMDSVELARQLREARPHRADPTDRPLRLREEIIKAMEAGISNYIVKPFTPQTLREKIDALFPLSTGEVSA